jgi:[acyl-carrier-protein] S-malonyltransferase
MVRWRESMMYLQAQGVTNVYEVGAGKVLSGIARRFDGLQAANVGTPEELEAVAMALSG